MKVYLWVALLVAAGGCQAGRGMERINYGLAEEQYGHAPELVRRVEREVPAEWNVKGSPHRISAYDKGRMLDIATTPENMEKVTQLLGDDATARERAASLGQ